MKNWKKSMRTLLLVAGILSVLGGIRRNKEMTALAEENMQTPVERYGALAVRGTHLVDQDGNPVQLKGVSTSGIAWFPEYVSRESFASMQRDWGIEIVRLAMYTAEYGGYCISDESQKEYLKKLVKSGVEYATELGLYVIVDWHILSDGNPETYKEEAKAFFDEMAGQFAKYDNVLYEICNEPNGGTSWPVIKSYAEEVIPVIRAHNPDSVVLIGTPTWSQEVDKAAADPVTGYTNLMYTLHYYAATHKDNLRSTLEQAIQNGLPVFVSEYGTCEASGNGAVDVASSDEWMKLLDKYQISSCIWNLSNKDESSAFFVPDSKHTHDWTEEDLTPSAKWFVAMMKGRSQVQAEAAETGQAASSQEAQQETMAGDLLFETEQNDVHAKAVITNRWTSEKGEGVQINILLANHGAEAVKSWKLSLDFEEEAELDQNWCCDIAREGNRVIMTPLDWNEEIAPSSSREDIGLILYTSTGFNVTDMVLEINGDR